MFMRAVHPGRVSATELEEFGMTPTEFARQISRSRQPHRPDRRRQALDHRRHRDSASVTGSAPIGALSLLMLLGAPNDQGFTPNNAPMQA